MRGQCNPQIKMLTFINLEERIPPARRHAARAIIATQGHLDILRGTA